MTKHTKDRVLRELLETVEDLRPYSVISQADEARVNGLGASLPKESHRSIAASKNSVISRQEIRPVVLLDFDDVIAVHPEHTSSRVLTIFEQAMLDDVPKLWENIFDSSACKNLRTLHDEFSPEYVISSSWATFLDRTQICEVLRRTGIDFVAENLHIDWCTPREESSYRLTEIEGWLDAHALGRALPFVILDDHISGQSIPGSHLEGRAVLCDAWMGFTHPKLRSAQKILRDQMR